MKLTTVIGTRPEIIRLSRVIALADEFTEYTIIHTGQNYDYELNQIFFDQMGIRKPDYFLGIDTTSVGKAYGETLIKGESALNKIKPDAILILGDTNSGIIALIAKRMRIPIYHMEAGNRCFDINVPEEINRKLIDGLADFNLVYSQNAKENLIKEGFDARRTYITGSPLFEVFNYYKDSIEKSDVLKTLKLNPNKYFLASFHREENVDKQSEFYKIIESLNAVALNYDMKIFFSTHPRTFNRFKKLKEIKPDKRIIFGKPFGFFDYVKLQKNALCVISDSGSISEESAILNFPAITVRNAMERPEAINAGTISLTGLTKDTVLDPINLVIEQFKRKVVLTPPDSYMKDNVSWRVIKLILGTYKLSNSWHNIISRDDI